MTYNVIYDGDCNLCSNLVQVLEKLDRGHLFQYVPMQDRQTLERFEITPQDCEMGMILIDADRPTHRWQGSDAAEEIGRLLPLGNPFIAAYRALPGMKWLGDRVYAQVRDRRYHLFGRRSHTYYSAYPIGCHAVRNSDRCAEAISEKVSKKISEEILNPHNHTVVS
ncbi:DCC1-like thiol-disulfide oxidoreductase family protein [Tumidithrix elongata RA019]|uniref:DCC1-like thiol-disulfide oxidoreductase family protein n=1 Tax=Tumidithrix elongata BACA0141 TaxID=2716417 RepID=A0AAW9Q740_9CYAN|nr:DCC1-like thiol-disulfide oxidoreductase family protein [Tumidithrix elongata RA019]